MPLRTAKDITPEAAQRLAELNLDQSQRIFELEAMILGLWEAMAPLFKEIKYIKEKNK